MGVVRVLFHADAIKKVVVVVVVVSFSMASVTDFVAGIDQHAVTQPQARLFTNFHFLKLSCQMKMGYYHTTHLDPLGSAASPLNASVPPSNPNNSADALEHTEASRLSVCSVNYFQGWRFAVLGLS
jgi:hypothetical protein